MKTIDLKRRMVMLGLAFAVATTTMVPSANAQTLKKKVSEEGELTIGIANTWPWGVTSKSGEVSGIYPDVIKAVVSTMGVKKVDFVVMDWGALIPSLLARRIDVVAAGLYITPARCEQVIFSDPVDSSGVTAIVKKGNPLDLHGFDGIAKNAQIRVGDIRGDSTTADAVAAGISKERIQMYQDNTAGIAALQGGRIDALLLSSGTVAGLLKDPSLGGLERAVPFKGLVVNGREKKDSGGIAFRPEDTEFRDLFNKSLAQNESNGAIKKIMLSYGLTAEDVAPKGLTAKDFCGQFYR
ncbi:polar amino acid transport system substrate-binding protein [Paraburkholderia sp. BL6669N2]|uniref:ectoine/hydroxyectoine ABC transporter substrate-binding protein EhuB n=1 Tax=Paraburkholderia sp. BL6669N2 TaxID=1938807 RepID=UPI000E222E87|nr:ectoine/hydroxyectoine ABC transporter substrate-binding protein EhuB [Paraburkholderia sp. BL6669N2]REG58633.1 polar amino acid transport system substrate-binding protein [Paraburkholderia sp. BL6669N2]